MISWETVLPLAYSTFFAMADELEPSHHGRVDLTKQTPWQTPKFHKKPNYAAENAPRNSCRLGGPTSTVLEHSH